MVTFADHPNQLKNYNFPKCVFGNEKQVILLKKENIKDATVACPQHALSMTHKNAVKTMVTLPRTCGDTRIKNQQYMIAVTTSLIFIARPIHGDGNESDVNFMRPLELRKRDVPELST